jgi:hypothetical protein
LFVYAKFLAPNIFGNSSDVVYVSLSDYYLIPDHRALLYSNLLLAERNSHLTLVGDLGCCVALPRWIPIYDEFFACDRDLKVLSFRHSFLPHPNFAFLDSFLPYVEFFA